MKICSKCNIPKDSSEYHKEKRGKEGLSASCKDCKREVNRRWRVLNKASVNSYLREYHANNKNSLNEKAYARRKEYEKQGNGIYWTSIKRKYGITKEEYLKMLHGQKGKCAICGLTKIENKKSKMVIDHCHKTGKVRGILCSSCNKGIGFLKDDPNLLENAIKYLNNN